MDDIDIKILEELKKNGRATASDISKAVSLSVPATAERIRKMERSGIIEGYLVKVNRKALGYKLLVFILVTLDTTENINRFRAEVVRSRHVLECHHVAGQSDYLLKVLVADTDELESFISDFLKGIPGVVTTTTIINLTTLKEEINV